MLNLPDRQIERHMASQSAEKEAKQRMSFNLLTILLMFFSVCWSPEVSLLSLGPWLFSWRSLCDQQKLLAHSASSSHHCCLWETCSFILLFVSPHFQPRAPVWVCLQPLPRTALVPYVRLPDLLWSHFPYSATSFTSSSPCTATSFPASHTVGLRSTGWCGVWSLVLPWGNSLSLLAAAQCTLCRKPVVLCESQSSASEHRVCSVCV